MSLSEDVPEPEQSRDELFSPKRDIDDRHDGSPKSGFVASPTNLALKGLDPEEEDADMDRNIIEYWTLVKEHRKQGYSERFVNLLIEHYGDS